MFKNMFPSIKKHIATFAVVICFLFIIACGGGGDNPPPPPPPPPTVPTISAVTPNSGNEAGGTQVILTGTNFVSGLAVTFGTASASVTNVVSTQITLTTPASLPGAVDVTVKNPDGQSATLKSGYTYVHTQTPQEAARAIMSKNYFGVEEAEKYFHITLSAADAASAYDIPYTRDTLTAKKDTHMLVLVVFSVSIQDLQARLPQGTIAFSSSWLASQEFVFHKSSGIYWVLIRKDLQPGSFNLSEGMQYNTFLKDKEWAMGGFDSVYAFTAYYMATGEVLLQGVLGRTSQPVNTGASVADTAVVGGNIYGGKIGIGNVPSTAVDPALGITSWWFRGANLVP